MDGARFEALVNDTFPDLQWSTTRVVTEGWDHLVLILDGQTVFRYPLEPDYANQLQEEIEFLERFAPRTSARIPRYRYTSHGGRFAGYDIVPGQPVTAERLSSFGRDGRQAFAEQLAAFLTALHTFERASAGPLKSFYVIDEQNEIRRVLGERVRPELTAAEFDRAERILDDVDAQLETAPASAVVHGDIYSRHLLWANGRLGVIDFSDRCWGDPAVDFGEVHELGCSLVEEVYALYAGPKDEGFLDRAWLYQQWASVYLMTDHFVVGKTTFAEARRDFDRVLLGRR